MTQHTTPAFNDHPTIDMAVEAGELRLRRVIVSIGLLWAALIPVMLLIFPGIALYHHVWVGFLCANLIVWPIVLTLGAVVEVRKGLTEARDALALRKAQRDEASPADGTLAIE